MTAFEEWAIIQAAILIIGAAAYYVETHKCKFFGHKMKPTHAFSHGIRLRRDGKRGVVSTKATIYACQREACRHTDLGPYTDENSGGESDHG